MTSIAEVREFYAVPRDLWGSFVQAAGDPGEDLKLLGTGTNGRISLLSWTSVKDMGTKVGSSGQTAKTEVPGERKLKMTQVIDQSDDGEFVVQ